MSASVSDQAELVAHTLNGFIGVLYAARVTAFMWLQHAEQHPIAAKYSLQMTGGTIFLTLRKFDEFWRSCIRSLLPKNSENRQKGEHIIEEIKKRHLLTTANQLVAHYGRKGGSPPLSEAEIVKLIKKHGWKTEQDFLMWIGPVIWNLIDVRDEIRRLYGVMESMDDAWMKNALDIVVSEPGTAKGGKHE